ncbi:polyphosphate kinase 2 family protein [bacterium]|nr:MAG: polyphosphate kinase 2 family protein [bacterium]
MKSVPATNLITVKPGHKIRLKNVDADAKGDYKTKEEPIARLAELLERRDELQERLYAEAKQSLLIVLQAMDTGGKDGATKRLLEGMNPAGIRVASFKVPSKLEMAHDYLWRIHAQAPEAGCIGVWNRSHYEDVLIARVHELVPKKTWRKRYGQINDFEEMLTENGTTILKFYLHISKDEQKERLQARLDDPAKHWKFSTGDLAERKFWDEYQKAFEDALNECSTDAAPWHIVPANHKWARDIAIAEKVTATLEAMNPKYPKVTFDPKTIVIE